MSEETTNYIVLIIGTIFISTILVFFIKKILNSFIMNYAKKLKADATNFSFIKNSVGFLIYTLAITFVFYKIPYLKSIGNALFAGAGIIAVVIGFASQKAFSNIISGIFILIFKPFKNLDIIEFKDGQKGIIEEITLRHTIIKNFENRRIIIPNSIISDETIINSTLQDQRIRKHIIFSISYDSNIDKAIDVIREEAENHPLLIDYRSNQEIEDQIPKVILRVVSLTNFSIDIKAYVWTQNNDDAFILNCDLLKSVKERFDKDGIEIPFPYRTIVFKKDLKNSVSDGNR